VGFTFLQKKKSEKNENTGFIRCSEQEKSWKNFRLFGRLKDDRQQFFKYFRMSYLKLETAIAQTLRRRIQDGDGA
jgi:hypothetical protein